MKSVSDTVVHQIMVLIQNNYNQSDKKADKIY